MHLKGEIIEPIDAFLVGANVIRGQNLEHRIRIIRINTFSYFCTKFVWKYTFDGTDENISKMVIPRTGKYKLFFKEHTARGRFGSEKSDDYYDKVDVFSIGTMFKSGEIKSTSGTSYSVRTIDEYGIPNVPDYEYIETTLQSIEYIGEA